MGEAEALLASLREQRKAVFTKVDGLTDGQARAVIVPSGWSVIDMVNHLALGGSAPSHDDPPARLPIWEFTHHWAGSLRAILIHLIEETARHAGHVDIVRELLDGHHGTLLQELTARRGDSDEGVHS